MTASAPQAILDSAPHEIPEWFKLWMDLAPYAYGGTRERVADSTGIPFTLQAPASGRLSDLASQLGLDGWLLELLRYSAAMCIEGDRTRDIPNATLRGFGSFHQLTPATLLGLWREVASTAVVREEWLTLGGPSLPLLDRPLLWSPAICDALLGLPPPGLHPLPPPEPGDNPSWTFGADTAQLDALLEPPDARAVLMGPRGCGKTSLLQRYAARSGRSVLTSTATSAALLERHARYASLTDAVLHVPHAAQTTRELVLAAWAQTPGRCVLESVQPLETMLDLEPRPDVVQLHVGTASERQNVSRALLGRALGAQVALTVAERHVLTIGETLRLRRECLERGVRDLPSVSAVLRGHAADALRGLAQLEYVDDRWDDFVVSDSIRSDLDALCLRYAAMDALRARYPDRAHRVSRRAVALFGGPPGVGKTMGARLVAARLELPCMRVDLSRIVSKYIGETEKRLGQVFDEAQKSDVLLLFDEADSLFARRTSVRSSHDRYANLEVAYLLQRLEQFEGVAILTTNLAHALDEAFERRIDFHIRFELPDIEQRVRLWRLYLPNCEHEHVDLEMLAEEYELSGSLIRKTCERAMFKASLEGCNMSTAMIAAIAARELGAAGALIREWNDDEQL